ncbi:hypothetical protein G6F56_008118 [Rhizopus delemar]|uniref:Uncharacterized protein n=1 Tax=Rhizopus stolonifer TaxID=4846 RepID=A0A367KB36_RHIST|nr:hypothetical protein G6F56_008118 [Rhizopus delemar]RCH99386.1 hypothetical protein CU098_007574 [Rhizopus stolonifer]
MLAEITTNHYSSYFEEQSVDGSASELGRLLKSAHTSLREKEKDLELVAEIGQSLLEYNQQLKRDYDHLLTHASTLTEQQDRQLANTKRASEKIIERLERKNEEIQSVLEHSKQRSRLSEQAHERHQRKLETEIQILQSNLDMAAYKVQELEEARQKCQERASKQYEIRIEQQRKEDMALLEELSIKMEELNKENIYLQKSKRRVEERLKLALKDLEHLHREFEQFETQQQNHQILQKAFERQTDHVQELVDRLEEQHQTKFALSDASTCNLMQELTSEFFLAERHVAYPIMNHTSLHGVQQLDSFDMDDTSTIYTQYNLYPSLKYLEPLIQTPPKSWFQRICSHVKSLYRSITRWCRFTLILATAVIINFWKGPDLLLEK